MQTSRGKQSKDQPVDEQLTAEEQFWTLTAVLQLPDSVKRQLRLLIQAECNRARITELKNLPIFYEYVESGDDKLDSQATIYIRQRIKELQQLMKGKK